MLYSVLRPLLFSLPPEISHRVTLRALDITAAAGLSRCYVPAIPRSSPVTVMGLEFPNRVGLAAGLDKNAAHIDGLAALGFGFIEVGTVTPRAQPGNPKPRMFRLPGAQALINRQGFNNDGVDVLLANIARTRWRGILGINIGKNYDTPLHQAADDYLACLRRAYPVAGYVAVNVSSPNTPGLRSLQQGDDFNALLGVLKAEQDVLASRHGRYVPLAVKLAPDLADAELTAVAKRLLAHGIDGVIATNTTVARDGVGHLLHADEAGGLSGSPLATRSTRAIAVLAAELAGRIPVIGVGGISTAAGALEKIAAGASLVQLYTGLIYRGPALVSEIAQACAGGSRQ
jgi:dihydroorotate dehydrogenase